MVLLALPVLACVAVMSAPGQSPVRKPAPLQGSEWPQFRGPSLNGLSPEKGIRKDWKTRPPVVRWKVDLTDDGYAGPCAAGGLVYIVDHVADKDVVRAFDVETGKERWRYAYEIGSEQWRYTKTQPTQSVYGFSRATPTVAKNRVYTLSREGHLNCLDARTGTLIWKRHLKYDLGGVIPVWGYTSPPMVYNGEVIVWPGGEKTAIAALNPADGSVIWQGGEGDIAGYGMPVPATILGKRQFVMTVFSGFVGAEAGTGKVLWRIPWETTDGTNIACPIVIGNTVFVTSSYDMGCALYDITPEGPKEVWRSKVMRAHMNTPVLYNGLLYGTGDPGYLMCLDPKTGEVRWRESGFEKGGVVGVDGVLLAVNGSVGDVVMVRLTPERYEEMGRFTPLGGQSWSPPIVAYGKLFIRNKKALACVDLR
jgi:outer membrane protein assembly factor BamB